MSTFERLIELLTKVEGNHTTPYDDDGSALTAHAPTIGIGLNLEVKENSEAVVRYLLEQNSVPFDKAHLELYAKKVQKAAKKWNGITREQLIALGITEETSDEARAAENAALMANLSNTLNAQIDTDRLTLENGEAVPHITFQFASEADAIAVSTARIENYLNRAKEKVVQANNGDSAGWDVLSEQQQAAVASLFYNAESNLGTSLMKAINKPGGLDQVAAWYEIRYQSNRNDLSGLAKRHYYESTLFGLYADPNNVTDTEAQHITEFLNKDHQDIISKYENKYAAMAGKAINDYSITGTDAEQIKYKDVFKPISSSMAMHYAGNDFAEDTSVNRDYDEVNIDLKTKVRTVTGIQSTNKEASINDLLINSKDAEKLLSGGLGNDTLIGNAAVDKLYGGSGDDVLIGNDGNDELHGYIGNDTLIGGGGSDIYYFNRGDGQDTIKNNDSSGTDRIVLGNDITREELNFTRSGDHLMIDVGDSGDQIKIDNYYLGENYQVNEISLGGVVRPLADVMTPNEVLVAGADTREDTLAEETAEGAAAAGTAEAATEGTAEETMEEPIQPNHAPASTATFATLLSGVYGRLGTGIVRGIKELEAIDAREQATMDESRTPLGSHLLGPGAIINKRIQAACSHCEDLEQQLAENPIAIAGNRLQAQLDAGGNPVEIQAEWAALIEQKDSPEVMEYERLTDQYANSVKGLHRACETASQSNLELDADTDNMLTNRLKDGEEFANRLTGLSQVWDEFKSSLSDLNNLFGPNETAEETRDEPVQSI